MARPQKKRKVCPGIQGYCFRGNDDSQPVEIPVDELEALRLCDLEERSQEAAAGEMNISRGTLQRLLYSAHKKIAFALLYGRTIQTEGRSDSKAACRKKCCRFCAETYRQIPSDYDKCLKFLRKALDIRRRILGENHPDTAVSYRRIGAVLRRKGDDIEAEMNNRRAYEIAKRFPGVGTCAKIINALSYLDTPK